MCSASLSVRASRAAGYPFATALPVGPTLRGLLAPPAGLVDAYFGVLALALAALALLVRPRHDRGAPVFLFAAGGFFLLLAFGRATPVLPFLVERVPGFALFREPNRYKCLAVMFAAATAAYGLDALLLQRRKWFVPAAVFAALAAGVGLLQAFVAPNPGALERVPAGYATIYGFLAVGAALAVGLCVLARRYRATLAAAFVGAAYLDLAVFGGWYVRATEAPVDDEEDRRYVADLPGVDSLWRVYDEFVMEQRPGSRLRVRNFRGYPSGSPMEDLRHDLLLKRLAQHPELLEVFNVRWVLFGPHHRNGFATHRLRQPPHRSAPQHARALDGQRSELLHPAPLAAWYGAVEEVADPGAALAALGTLEDPDGRFNRAIVERRDVPRHLSAALTALRRAPTPAPTVAGQLSDYAPDRIGATIDAPAAGVVVLNEAMYPGWRVTVDGRAATPFRVNYLLRGVLVDAGTHTIVWRFAPAHYAWLVAGVCAGLAVVLAAAASGLLAKQQKQRDHASGDDRASDGVG